ncbi:hypothetical protein FH972_022955 [Carpinus fangiana]|uniref:CobQ/CobB/MinD/ParA nucleotide binding domain-containing protein n=1 Tax=Carpinus fangiana TaxID=176857 RepID=A0A5N6KTS0_9ROSI|nr:hypothetical protein FH972_022955 [Carpinus fangiana]
MNRRLFSSLRALRNHDNPLGLPKAGKSPGPNFVNRMQRGLPERRKIQNVKHVVAISSAKGGVGKSTIAANLALALARKGHRTGILDTDLYGPSIPTLFNLADAGDPDLDKDGRLIPLPSSGVQTMSMGYLTPPGAAVVWRGPMLQKAIQQLLHSVAWSPLDVLFLDLPPGTGDIQLTITQQIHLAGSVIVTTPQKLALEDAAKGVEMFNKSGVRVLGLVSNMSRFACPGCGGVHRLFGSEEGIKAMCEKQELAMLGDVPLDVGMGEESPSILANPHGPAASELSAIADNIVGLLGLGDAR